MDFIIWKVHYTQLLSVVVLLVLATAGVCMLVQGANDSEANYFAGIRAGIRKNAQRARKKIMGVGSNMAAWVSAYVGANASDSAAVSKPSASSLCAKIIVCVLAILLALLMASFSFVKAYAADGSGFTGAEGADASAVSSDQAFQINFGNDVLWFGRNWNSVGAASENDILAAGQSITLQNAQVKGSIRVAGQGIHLSNVSVGQSITLAGQHISMEGGAARSVALAGQDVAFSGEADELRIVGSSVSINGVVHGDVYVEAKMLTFGDGAVIEGTVHASVSQEPLLAPGAKVGNMDVGITKTSEISPLAGAHILLSAITMNAVMSVLGVFVSALLMETFLRRQTVQSAAMVKVRTVPMLLGGTVGALVAPVALVVLLLTLVGAPLAVALAFVLVGLQIIAAGFAAASLAKVAFPKMNRFKGAMLMGLLVGILDAIPFVGFLVPFAAFLYTLGYVLQKIYLGMRLPVVDAPSGEMPAAAAAGGADASLAEATAESGKTQA